MLKLFDTLYRAVLLSFFFLLFTNLLSHVPAFGQTTRLSGGQTRILTDVQSGTAYTIPASDCGKLISFSNPNSVAVTIPQAGPAGLANGCWMDIQNLGPGAVTLTPVASLIDQMASLQLTMNQGLRLFSTGAGYLTERGQGVSSGVVTGTTGALVPAAIVTGNGGLDIKTPVSAATMDGSGNISIPGTLTTNTACRGCAGAIDLPAGADPGAGQLANSFSWIAPQSMGSSYRWKVPSADSAGAIVSDGAATPGTLSIVPFSGTGSIAKANSPVLTTPVLTQPIITNYTVGTLPAGATTGTLAYVTDGSTATDCTGGHGEIGVLCAYNGSAWEFPGSPVPGVRRITAYTFDGGGSALSGTLDACADVSAAATITGVTLLADKTGSATVDVRTVGYANYTGPESASTITASATPALTSAIKYQDAVLKGWNDSLPADTVICFHLTGASTVTWIMVDVMGIVQ